MMSPESYLFDLLTKELRSRFKGISVYPEEVQTPASFPCVTFTEDNNTVLETALTGDGREHAVRLMYSVNVYSNLQTGGKQQCKDIMDVVDSLLMARGLRRTMNQPMNNIQLTIHRRTARYVGTYDENGLMYRR